MRPLIAGCTRWSRNDVAELELGVVAAADIISAPSRAPAPAGSRARRARRSGGGTRGPPPRAGRDHLPRRELAHEPSDRLRRQRGLRHEARRRHLLDEVLESASACVEIRMTVGPPAPSRAKSRATSKPLSPPSTMSTSTTSGHSSHARRRASAAFDARPTTVMPSRSRSVPAACRKDALSSTIRHRSGTASASHPPARIALKLAASRTHPGVTKIAVGPRRLARGSSCLPTASGAASTFRPHGHGDADRIEEQTGWNGDQSWCRRGHRTSRRGGSRSRELVSSRPAAHLDPRPPGISAAPANRSPSASYAGRGSRPYGPRPSIQREERPAGRRHGGTPAPA
jgi:hypothetical protein